MFGNEFECSCRKLYTGEFCEEKNQEEKEKIKKKLKERRKNGKRPLIILYFYILYDMSICLIF